jgi:hypothetical protein
MRLLLSGVDLEPDHHHADRVGVLAGWVVRDFAVVAPLLQSARAQGRASPVGLPVVDQVGLRAPGATSDVVFHWNGRSAVEFWVHIAVVPKEPPLSATEAAAVRASLPTGVRWVDLARPYLGASASDDQRDSLRAVALVTRARSRRQAERLVLPAVAKPLDEMRGDEVPLLWFVIPGPWGWPLFIGRDVGQWRYRTEHWTSE